METYNWKLFPPCFKARSDYELWLDTPNSNPSDRPAELASKHCTDCLPSFKMRMAKCGRCEHPETVFSFTPEEFDGETGVAIEGHWNRSAGQQVVRFSKARGRPRKPNAKLIAMGINPAPVGRAAEEERQRKYWEEQERLMRERMTLGR